ncbi:MAG: imidazolonepropionase [Actinomycetota bacterium]
MKLIRDIGRLFTATERGVIENAAVVVRDAHIDWVGPEGDLPARLGDAEEIDASGALVTPGLIDAHTHPVYAGNRLHELSLRSAGASYAELGAAGGGIGSTVAATRAATRQELTDAVHARMRSWLQSGTTTVEAKTGYHLDRDGEIEAVEILDEVGRRDDTPRVMITFLPVHAMPPGLEVRPDDHVDASASWCVAAAEEGARFCDVFCDEGYFTVEQSRRFLEAGRTAGLIPRIHADELARTGGSLLAAELGAASADHLLEADESDAHALAAAGVVATLAPTTALSMKKLPPVQALIDAGATIALGTDHNPGTSGLTDMTVAIALAVNALQLSVERALTAATRGGAQSLRMPDAGRVQEGARADLVQWDAEHEGVFAWTYGVSPLQVWLSGAEAL